MAAAPPAGARFFYSKKRVEQCATMQRCRDQAKDFRPNALWRSEQKIDGPRRPGARLADALGMGRILPADIAARVLAPLDEITVYKVL